MCVGNDDDVDIGRGDGGSPVGDRAMRPQPTRSSSLVRIGLNHRYHRAFRQAREIFESGALGPLMFVRGRYGHGGRPGYEREWRARPELFGRRRANRPGHAPHRPGPLVPRRFPEGARARPHLLLEHAGRGQRLPAAARPPPARWPSCTPAGRSGRTCFPSRSWAATGKLEISGLGGSYGVERLAFYHMFAEMGPPETTIWEYPTGGRLLGARIRRVPGGHPPRPTTLAGPRRTHRPRCASWKPFTRRANLDHHPHARCASRSAAAARTCRRTTANTPALSWRPPSTSTSTSRSTRPSPRS